MNGRRACPALFLQNGKASGNPLRDFRRQFYPRYFSSGTKRGMPKVTAAYFPEESLS